MSGKNIAGGGREHGDTVSLGLVMHQQPRMMERTSPRHGGRASDRELVMIGRLLLNPDLVAPLLASLEQSARDHDIHTDALVGDLAVRHTKAFPRARGERLLRDVRTSSGYEPGFSNCPYDYAVTEVEVGAKRVLLVVAQRGDKLYRERANTRAACRLPKQDQQVLRMPVLAHDGEDIRDLWVEPQDFLNGMGGIALQFDSLDLVPERLRADS